MTRTFTRRIVITAATAVIPACIALTGVTGASSPLAGRATPPGIQLSAQYLPQAVHAPQARAAMERAAARAE